MYQLYWDVGTAAFAPQALLEETQAPYTLVRVELAKKANRAADYLRLNPGGYIPTLVTEEGTVVTESAAILIFLAERHALGTLYPGVDETADRGSFLRWLFYLTNNIQDAYKRYYYTDRYSTDAADVEAMRDKAALDLLAYWGVINDHLAVGGPFMLGQGYSALDIYLVMLMTWFEPEGDLIARFPDLAICFGKVVQRPAVARVIEAHEEAWALTI